MRLGKNLDDHKGPARLLGYIDVYDLIREILRMRDYQANSDRYLALILPVYVKLVGFSSVQNGVVEVRSRLHTGLKGIQLNIVANSNNPSGYLEPYYRSTRDVKRATKSSREHFVENKLRIKIGKEKPLDYLQATLIHRRIPEIGVGELNQSGFTSQVGGAFSIALSQFCPPDRFEDRLMNPELCDEKELKADAVFEDAVSWLLALGGYSVIHLRRDYEQLRGPNNYSFGSVDILAQKATTCSLN